LLPLYPVIFFWQIWRYVSGKSKPGWRERWGGAPAEDAGSTGQRTGAPVWVHAVSAGEVVAAVPILKELRTNLPNTPIVLSVTTPAGREMADQQAASIVDCIFYSPFDLPFVVSRVVNRLRPSAFVSLESEMWPNLLHRLKVSGCANVIVNGRLSERSHRRIVKFARPIFVWMLSNMTRVLVQGEADAARFRSLLPAERSTDVVVLGNSKFDQAIARLNSQERATLKQALKLPEASLVFLAGSTRSPEEEEVVISAYLQAKQRMPDLCLVIAPRQIDRAQELESRMRSHGLNPVRKTQIALHEGSVQHLILDTMGELANAYAVCDAAFVGNSFEPVVKGGGQNLLQPLAHGKPTLFGPRVATIRSEAALALEHGVGFQAASAEELTASLIRILQDPELRGKISIEAVHLIEANRGVSQKYASAVMEAAHLAPETGSVAR
jgi:3-deoxy-D-manno-octulosonic-acid transferase